jgi:hypothetical protein
MKAEESLERLDKWTVCFMRFQAVWNERGVPSNLEADDCQQVVLYVWIIIVPGCCGLRYLM